MQNLTKITPHLEKVWQHYATWLDQQDFPPKSYREHPIESEEVLNKLKSAFNKAMGFSLGQYIRLKRINYLLHNVNEKYNNTLSTTTVTTPLGEMLAIFSEKGLCLLEFYPRKMLESELVKLQKTFKANFQWETSLLSQQLQQELDRYFSGELTEFSLPLDPIGTPFQLQVWQELQKIPYGKTISYQQEANQMQRPSAVRAVANANGKNMISILIPCHRVIASDGGLGGYGGGIENKKKLLELEKYRKSLC